uniref:Uncharacterized protein n=1 Tax=Arundo donax TaxID=35708 RepID=A0A0A8YNY7_ARUDO
MSVAGTSGNSNGTSDGLDGTPGRSSGTSNETAVVRDEEFPCPTGAAVTGNITAFADPRDSGPQIHDLSAGGLDDMLNYLLYESYLHRNFQPQIHQGSAQAAPHNDASSMPQGPSNPDTCNMNNDGQEGKLNFMMQIKFRI